jgi:Na+/H+-dicarboxylate symporter
LVHKLKSYSFSSAGFILRPFELSSDAVMLMSYPGELFMRLLKLLILPLIVASITAGKSKGQ